MQESSNSLTPGMASPSVSILINNYNYERFLRQCIQSCLSQTQDPLEIIVVDDGSVDASSQIIREYSEASSLVVPVLKGNGGQASALNLGFCQSRGELIVLLDADDYLYPWAIEQITQAVHGLTLPPVMVQCRLDLVDAQGNYIDQYPPPELSFDDGNVVPQLLKTGQYSTTVTSGLSFPRSLLTQVMPIPEEDFRLCADGYLISVAPFYGSVVSVETSIGGRRKHDSNLWAREIQSAAQCRKAIEHDFARYHHLRQTATKFNLVADAKMGLRDPLHLSNRLASLRLESSQHPVSDDRAWRLALNAIQAIWEYSNLSHRRRIVLMLWFLGAGLLPQRLAQSVIQWRFSTQSRPVVVNRMLKLLRTATQ